MNLSEVIKTLAYKELTSVDLPHKNSNQHEINGVSSLQEFFQTNEKISGTIIWQYFADTEETQSEEGSFTFYDAREKTPDRTEWRLYYNGDFLSIANPEDILILIKTITDKIYGLIFRGHSAWLYAAKSLFSIEVENKFFRNIPEEKLRNVDIEFTKQLIFDELELPINLPTLTSDEDIVVERFGDAFPATKEMSQFARSLINDKIDGSDELLTKWIAREDQLFRALEKIIVEKQIHKGFDNVESFISYSLSVTNRRKSRMGHSLQNHLEALFLKNDLKFETQKNTEGKNRPDFIFPGTTAYHNINFKADLLTMLAAKSTIKERWRQILTEANRITEKHLCTLAANVSNDQISEIKTQMVKLVIPESIRRIYPDIIKQEILTIENFIEAVKQKQTNF